MVFKGLSSKLQTEDNQEKQQKSNKTGSNKDKLKPCNDYISGQSGSVGADE